MNFTIDVDHQKRLIRYKHSGDIPKDDIGQAWQQFLKLKEFTHEKYNLLSDYRKSKFIFEFEDLNLITNFLSTLKAVLNGKKQALILDEPESTALSLLFEGDVTEKTGFIVKVFSTEEEAVKWLME
jgi:hypothetical protein